MASAKWSMKVKAQILRESIRSDRATPGKCAWIDIPIEQLYGVWRAYIYINDCANARLV